MKKQIVSFSLALCMVFGSAAALPQSFVTDQTGISASAADSDWNYQNYGSGVKLTLYKGANQANVTIPSKVGGKTVVALGFKAFQNCSKLTTVTVPSTVTIIDGTFTSCTNLKTVKGMANVTEFGLMAFYNCKSLTSISLPKKLQKIGSDSFAYCEKLKKISIPASVTEIKGNAFAGCDNLTSIQTTSANKKYVSVNGILYDKNKTTLIACPAGKASVSTIQKSITSIGISAFSGCKKLISIAVPSKVKSIGAFAFSNCDSLKTISMPSGVKEIGIDAFDYCDSLTTVSLPNGLTEIKSSLFYHCDKLKTINIPASVKTIAHSFIDRSNNVTKLNVNSKNKTFCTINGNIYSKDKKTLVLAAKGITTLSFPSKTTAIADNACEGCRNLTKVTIPSRIKNFGSYCFLNTPWLYAQRRINSLVVKNGVLIDGMSCKNKLVNIPNGVKKVSKYAFYDNSYVEKVVIPASVSYIQEGAFYYCTNLKTVTVPDTVKGLGIAAFANCSKLENVKLGTGFPTLNEGAFYRCTSLKSIEIPHNVVNINTVAFEGCTNLSDVSLPYSKLSIGSYAFGSTYALKSVVIPDTVKSIATSAFYRASSYDKSKNLVIFGYKNSVAQKYAKDYFFNFKTLPPYQRMAGDDRFATAVAISKKEYSKADTVVLVSGMDYHDALAAVPLASAYKAPMLLTTADAVPNATLNEIKRLKAKKIIVVSTNGAVSSKVIKTLKNKKYSVSPLTGKTCFETAKKVAENLQKKTGKAPASIFITTDKNYADALSASPVAAVKGSPILYVDPKANLNSNTVAYLKKIKASVKNVYIVGGVNAVSKNVVSKIKNIVKKAKYVRFDGNDRYETCYKINKSFKSTLTGKTLCLAKGYNFPDALAGGVFAAKNKAPMVLSDNNMTAAQIKTQNTYLKSKKASKIFVFGGQAAVPDRVLATVSKGSV